MECGDMNWISVKDELPDCMTKVFVIAGSSHHATNYRTVFTAYYGHGHDETKGKVWLHGCCHLPPEHSRVTHWMPIPEIPDIAQYQNNTLKSGE
jgi:hypothetical protein